jgi:GxxExxY protein
VEIATDIIVENRVLLELKTVEKLLPIHQAQLFTYLKLAGLRVGFLMNFNAINLRYGLRRFVV